MDNFKTKFLYDIDLIDKDEKKNSNTYIIICS